MSRQRKTVMEQVQAKYKEFAQEVDGLSVKELESRISNYQKQLEESETHREENVALRNAKEEAAELSGPYNDVKKAVKLKTKYIIALIKEKGGQ